MLQILTLMLHLSRNVVRGIELEILISTQNSKIYLTGWQSHWGFDRIVAEKFWKNEIDW
jgi:hypothetical protein